ncbi:MAG: sugar MFS transporter [Acidobacteriaceae bacterium]
MAIFDDRHRNRRTLMLVTALFFLWGLLASMNDILIPYLKSVFDLSYSHAMLVQASFFCAYLFFAIPAGCCLEHCGYKRMMVAGLTMMGTGSLLLVMAASMASFTVFLVAFSTLATGVTMLQVTANPYIATLGPEATASSRLSLAQGFNSLGTTISPYLGGLFILRTAVGDKDEIVRMSAAGLHAYRLHRAAAIKSPYMALAICIFIFAIFMTQWRFPSLPAPQKNWAALTNDSEARKWWRKRNFVGGTIGIFLYVGAEVAIGSFLVNYLTRPEIGGITERVASVYVSLYWGGAMIGRFIGAGLFRKLQAGNVLCIAAIAACSLICMSMASSYAFAMWSIVLVGLFNSVMFPSIFILAIRGLGPFTPRASGILITAISGGAVIPLLQGILADHIGVQHAFLLPVLCYLYIVFYAFREAQVPLSLPQQAQPDRSSG